MGLVLVPTGELCITALFKIWIGVLRFPPACERDAYQTTFFYNFDGRLRSDIAHMSIV